MIRIQSLPNRDTALRPSARPVIATHGVSFSARNRYHPCLSTKDRGGKEWRCTTPNSMSHTRHVMRLHSAVEFSHCSLSGLLDGPQPAPLPYLQFSSQQTTGSCKITIPVPGSVLHVTVRPICCYLQVLCSFHGQAGRRRIQAARESHKRGSVHLEMKREVVPPILQFLQYHQIRPVMLSWQPRFRFIGTWLSYKDTSTALYTDLSSRPGKMNPLFSVQFIVRMRQTYCRQPYKHDGPECLEVMGR